MIKKLLITSIIFGWTTALMSQVTGITVETYYQDDNSVAGYPSDHKTYRIYAQLTHPTDRLTAVFGGENSPLFLRTSGSGIWNYANGGNTAYDILCSELGSSPLTEYDSYLAIGYACRAGNSNTIYAMDDPNTTPWLDEAFNTTPYGIGNIEVSSQVGGLWFALPSDTNTQAGNDLKVLIAQITTDGEICGNFNFQVFPEYNGVGSEYIEQSGFSFGSLENSTIAITTDITSPSCDGTTSGSIEVMATGGTGTLSYSTDNITYGSTTVWENLNAGTYLIYVKDATGCIATTIVDLETTVNIDANWVVFDMTCHDMNNASIEVIASGDGQLQFSIDGENYQDDPIFPNLSAGTYQVHVIDVHQCIFVADEEIVIVNPDQINATAEGTFVTCFGEHDGTISFSVEGGIPPYEFNYGEGFTIDNPITNVGSGTYTVLVRDAVGCVHVLPEMVIVAEPTAITISGLSPVLISDTPGGNTEYTVSGGIEPYTFEWTNSSGSVVSTSQNLPPLWSSNEAGSYTLTITDAIGCSITQTIVIDYQVSVNQLNAAISLAVFPNPTTHDIQLQIGTDITRDFQYKISDTQGRVVLQSFLGSIQSNTTKTIGTSSLPAGVYFLELTSKDYHHTSRLIKL